MKAQVGSLSGTATAIGVVYSAQTFDVALRTSPLKLDITLDTDRGTSGSLRYGDRTSLSLSYQNTDNAPLKDVQIVMSIDGDAALLKDIDPDEGYYDSIKRTITWNKAIVSELSSLAPGAQGNLRIVIPIVLKGTNSPSLKLSVTGTGTKLETNDVVASISRAWVVQGSANLSAATAYKNSPFVNTGPIPPAPNVDTTYAAHVVVSAQNALVNAKVSFILPVYSNWRGVVSAGAAVSYDQRTRTVTWNIGNLPAGRTTVVDIGLSVRPAQSHVGKTPAITSGIVLDADEEVSRAHIRTTISGLTTAISGESWSTDPSYVVDR
jgi:hypothetical protein